jgi:hypothetical protein
MARPGALGVPAEVGPFIAARYRSGGPLRRHRHGVRELRTITLFVLAAVAETGGAWPVWQDVR